MPPSNFISSFSICLLPCRIGSRLYLILPDIPIMFIDRITRQSPCLIPQRLCILNDSLFRFFHFYLFYINPPHRKPKTAFIGIRIFNSRCAFLKLIRRFSCLISYAIFAAVRQIGTPVCNPAINFCFIRVIGSVKLNITFIFLPIMENPICLNLILISHFITHYYIIQGSFFPVCFVCLPLFRKRVFRIQDIL